MNRLIIIAGLALIVPGILFGQIGWTEHTVADSIDAIWIVFAIDIEPDGDVDILEASPNENHITWWENDGDENFTEHTISDNYGGAKGVFAIDIDDDGDVDVLGAAETDNDVTWWENDGGSPPNFTEHTIDSTFSGASCVLAIDIEPDGDIDVVGASTGENKVKWYENDGNENFTEYPVADSFENVWSIRAIDLDDDNDVDVLGAATGVGEITWWENDGDENFTEHTISDNVGGARCVFAIDLDDDNDIDVLGGSSVRNKILWWENDGGSPPNFTEHMVADSLSSIIWPVYAIDMDNDDDIDVLGGTFFGYDVAWYENDGGSPPDFTEHTIADSFSFVVTVYAIDLDDDDDVDVLGGTLALGSITWWESDLNDLYDVSPVSIDIPSSVPEDTTLNPKATVKNLGTRTETFIVTCEIEPGGYMKTQTVQNLVPGDSIQVIFTNTFTFESGVYTATVYTRLGDDDNPANDTLEKVIETQDPGVAEGNSDTPEVFSFSAPTISRNRANIELSLPTATGVTLLIYDAVGRLSETLISKKISAGTYTIPVSFDLPAGVYFYNLKTASGENIIQKFLLIE